MSLDGISMSQTKSPYKVSEFSLMRWTAKEISEDLCKDWQGLLDSSKNLNVLLQSPQWFEHLLLSEPEKRMMMGFARDNTGRILGIVPIQIGQRALKFDVSGRSFWKVPLRTGSILGSIPLLPEDTNLHDLLFEAIWRELQECDCIYMDSVPRRSFLWGYLHRSPEIRDRYFIYAPDGLRPYYSLSLPTTFREYLSGFKAKKRYNLKRQVKIMRKEALGDLRILRVDSEDRIRSFLDGAVCVARNSWQQARIGVRIDRSQERYAELVELSKRGLLRSYLLKFRDAACAFVLGYQFRDVYHYAEIAYDQSFSDFSPGTVLLYLIIEDLIQYNPARQLNFGIGDASYKRVFGNVQFNDASVLLLRRNRRNLLLRTTHSAFRSFARCTRECIQKVKAK